MLTPGLDRVKSVSGSAPPCSTPNELIQDSVLGHSAEKGWQALCCFAKLLHGSKERHCKGTDCSEPHRNSHERRDKTSRLAVRKCSCAVLSGGRSCWDQYGKVPFLQVKIKIASRCLHMKGL